MYIKYHLGCCGVCLLGRSSFRNCVWNFPLFRIYPEDIALIAAFSSTQDTARSGIGLCNKNAGASNGASVTFTAEIGRTYYFMVYDGDDTGYCREDSDGPDADIIAAAARSRVGGEPDSEAVGAADDQGDQDMGLRVRPKIRSARGISHHACRAYCAHKEILALFHLLCA